MNKKTSKYKEGFGLLEVVIGITIISISIFSLIAVAQITSRVSNQNSRSIKASFLLEEGLEAVKTIRDSGWTANIDSLSIGTDYYLEFNGTNWQTTGSNVFIDNVFERKFVVGDVYRDANDDIVSAGTLDLNAKKLTVFVSWRERSATTTKNISTYITNFFDN